MTGRTEAVRARLRRYADGDDDAIAGVEALKDVGAVLAADVSLDQARLCGLLLWFRDSVDDLVSALALLERVWRADPARLPEPIAEYFAEFGPGPVRPTDVWQGPALALTAHFRRTGDVEAAGIAVALHRRIVAAAPAGEPERNMYLANLAMALQEQAELTGSGEGLDEAIVVGREAMAAFGEDDPRRAVPTAATAVALRRRSARTGRLADLDEAIVLGRAAGQPANLGVALTYRYEWTGDPADLGEALAIHRAGRGVAHATNLATTLLVAFEETGEVRDLDEAHAALAEAAGTPDLTAVVRATVHSARCDVLRTRFRYTGNAADLDQAVAAGRTALAALPPGHPDRAAVLTNLALARHVRAVRRDDPADLDQAITDLTEAVSLTPPGDPDLAGRHSNRCDALLSRADRHDDAAAADLAAADRAAAVASGRAAVRAGARHRRRAAYLSNLGNALFAAGDLDGAVAAHDEAVAAGPPSAAVLANLALALHERDGAGDRERSLAANRRAARLETGPVEVRIRAAIRWGHRAATAGDFDDALAGYTIAVDLLAAVSPRDLPRADQEFELARLAGVAGDAAACALRAGDTAAAVRLLERGRGIVLTHALPAAPDAGPAAGGAAVASEAGAVVMVNVSRFGSDALLLTVGGIAVEPLPGLEPGTLRRHAETFLVALDRRDESAVAAILDWLWDTIAGPVLDRLGFAGAEPLPRLWWCPTGLLSILPLHAAGRVPERVISSTTPSLWALANARRAPRCAQTPELLAVAPDASALPAVRDEIGLLVKLFGDRAVVVADPDAATIVGHRRVHVAGHAVADLTNPSRSAVIRTGGPPITADELIRLRRPDGELAYLSACETARTSPALADETVHLASVLHVIGYRHVVATLWTIPDRPAFRVARDVYTDLAAHDDVDRIPVALHKAMRDLRERYPRSPLVWASFVHIGP
jgi:tetratricopeptide (TPR) repeat protein